MTSRTLRRFLVAILLVGALLSPTLLTTLAGMPLVQQADPVVIGFDDLATTPWGSPDQAVVSDQYADLGVTFNNPKVLDFAGGGFGDPDFVHSGSNAIQQCYSEEKCDTPLVMTFSEPQQRVKVWVGLRDGINDALQVTLTAFDAPQGGDEIASASATLGPSGGQSIPVQVPLEVAAKGAIQRAEVTYSPQSDAASQLVVDDVEFEPDRSLPACPAGTAAPEIVLDQPTDGSKVQIDDITLQGSVATTAPLTRATLTVANDDGDDGDDGIVPLDVLSSFPQAGGAFGPFVVDDALRKGTNDVTLTVANCADTAEARANIKFSPIKARTRYVQLGLEVTQTIQDSANSVMLIADKPTFVRVYLRAIRGEQEIRLVSGKLRGCAYADESTGFVQPDDVQPGVVRSDDVQRECLGTPAEFLPLPPLGPITVNDADERQTQRDNLQMPIDDPDTDVNEGKIPPPMNYGLLFQLPPEWIHAGHLRLQFDGDSLSPRPPTCEDCDAITDVEFVAAQPLALNLVDTRYEVDGTPIAPREIDHQRVESWLERAYPTAQVTVSMPTELPLTTQDPNCRQVNAEMFAAISTAAIASPSQPLDARTRYYGLVASKGQSPMTGCTTTSPGVALIDRIASGPVGSGAYTWDIDGSYADFYAGHEIAHTFDQKHPGVCPDEGADDLHPPQFTHALISGEGHDYVGFDPAAYNDDGDETWQTTYPGGTWHDIMTYCDPRWIASRTYEALFQPIDREETTTRALAAMATPAPGQAALAAQAPGQQVLLVSGIIDTTNGSFIRRPFSVLPGDLVTPRPADSPYTIVLREKDVVGRVVRETAYPFNPRFFTDQPPPPAPQLAQLAEVVPWIDRTNEIEIRNGTRALDTIPVNTPPTVTLLSPNGGETLGGRRYRVAWQSSDPETPTADLTHTLLYSTDNGVTWMTAVGNITGQEYQVDPDRLPGSDHALFRIIVTDGVLTAQDDSDATFTVTDKPPQVDIVSPHDGATFTSASTIVLTGHATDIELGELDATMEWADTSQSPPVLLGTGRSVGVPNLTPGVHTITLTAKDDKKHAVTDSISITITDANPPHLLWPEPVPASQLREGQFFYDGAEELGAFYTTDGAGGIQHVRSFDVLLNGWTAIVPGNFGGDETTDLLFYDAPAGIGEFFASDGTGELQLLSGNEGFTKGWDIIVPGNFDDDEWTDLFFYNADAEEGKFYTTDGTGRISLLGKPRPYHGGWSSILPGEFGGDDHTDLLFYDKTTGLTQLYATDGDGGLNVLNDNLEWPAGWDHIVSGNFGGEDGLTDLFLLDTETGNAAVVTADGTGMFAPLGKIEPFPTHWTTVMSGDFGGDTALTDLFFYDAEQGLGRYYLSDGQGGLEQLSNSDAFPTGWDQIVPGYFEST